MQVNRLINALNLGLIFGGVDSARSDYLQFRAKHGVRRTPMPFDARPMNEIDSINSQRAAADLQPRDAKRKSNKQTKNYLSQIRK